MPHGFSIERVLLTVFLIVLVISIILPLIPRRPHRYRYAYVVKQKAYFKSFDTALEIFKSELVDYPPSDALDELKRPYCGAMKLCEAVVGQDFEGFHPNSKFRRDRTDDSGNSLYDSNTLKVRKGPYLPLETANAYRLKDLYNNVGPFDGNNYVLCDVFRNIKHIETGKRVGMPTLYYEANTAKSTHDINDPNNPENIYNYRDNHALLALGVPGKPGKKHPLFENPKIFYEMTKDYKDTTQSKPNNAQTFILLSAGKDGLYGTGDDVANFEIEWKPK
ncbi:MAG: hypothetical protein A2Z25_10185 [Planctomycetes bacterium RBG_16_55_9]|nr:MAG: hypothetical protein A2Z25_10185 [Planctomycetes bacterium RBG_16_55_9]